jgi:exodeoxyribonuclease-3
VDFAIIRNLHKGYLGMNMKIASWNVNSLRVRLPQVLDWIQQHQPDILAIQETKMVDESFPKNEIESAGYSVSYSGQKTYNGVAVLSKQIGQDMVTDIPGLEDPQRRILEVTIGDTRVLNLYVVNGSEVDSEKYRYKLYWLEKVTQYIREQIQHFPNYVVLGDFNIAPDDRDVYEPELWHEKILCSTPEREALNKIFDLGLRDTFRLFTQKEGSYSWWDYRTAGFRRNAGLRIDLILASESLSQRCLSSEIDKEPRGWKRPSDHAPVNATFRA